MADGFPGSHTVEVEFTAGVWTNVASLVRSYNIRRGRDSQFTDIQPGTLTFTLDNTDGTFTPDNPTSTYWPNFVEGKRVRIKHVKSAITCTLFLGQITSIDPEYPTSPTQAVTTVTATDSLGKLQSITLDSAPTMQALYLNPVAYYPLDETATATRGSNVARTTTAPALVQRTTGRGGSLTFEDASGPGVDSSAAPTFTPVDGQNGQYLISEVDYPLATTGNFSLECWFASSKQAAASSSEFQTIVALVNSKNAGTTSSADNYVDIYTFSDRTFGAQTDTIAGKFHTDASVNNGTSVASDAGVLDGNLHHVVFTESTSAGTVTQTLYLDGASYSTNTYALSSNPARGFLRLQVGGKYGPIGYPFSGSVSGVGVYNFPLSAGQVSDNYLSGKSRAANDTLQKQLDRLTAWTGVTCTSFTGAMTRPAVLAPTKDRSALDVLLEIARGESGIAYHRYSDDIVYVLERTGSRLPTVDIPLDSEADLDDGPKLVRNSADRVSIGVGKSATATATYIDSTLASSIGPVSGETTTTLRDDAELLSVATDRISQGRDIALRLQSVVINATTATSGMTNLLGTMAPGMRARVTLPSSHFGVTYKDGYVEGWTVSFSWDVGIVYELDLSDADFLTEGVWGTARWAFGDGVATVTSGTAVGTTSTGTIVVTWTGSSTLSTSAGDYPQDFNWNGERVTVTSAPAGSTSPQTLTITARGVAPSIARSHSAGEAIDVYAAGRWAL